MAFSGDPHSFARCVCGQEGLKKVYTITTSVRGVDTDVFPIGSNCISHFEEEGMMADCRHAEESYHKRLRGKKV
jgi:hypothetical protein